MIKSFLERIVNRIQFFILNAFNADYHLFIQELFTTAFRQTMSFSKFPSAPYHGLLKASMSLTGLTIQLFKNQLRIFQDKTFSKPGCGFFLAFILDTLHDLPEISLQILRQKLLQPIQSTECCKRKIKFAFLAQEQTFSLLSV